MKDYYLLEPDEVYLLGKHFNRGRGGAKVEFITRHHLMYIGDVRDVVDKIWNTRAASAHIVIDPFGSVGQAVWDDNTAWANASPWANARTIAIEHSNSTGRHHGNDYHNDSWNISDETLIAGARVAAAYCLFYGLGRPRYGQNIRDHNEFTATGCPVHLQGPRPGNAWGGKAGKYHYRWMQEATRFYDALVAGTVAPDGTPLNTKEPIMANAVTLGGVSAAALNDTKLAAIEAEKLARANREALTQPLTSVINPAAKFRPTEMLRLIDASTWRTEMLVNEIARVNGIDAEDFINRAIAADRAA